MKSKLRDCSTVVKINIEIVAVNEDLLHICVV